MAINGPPQMLQGGPPTQQPGNRAAAPHHMMRGGQGPMWGSQAVPGQSNQVANFIPQGSQQNLPVFDFPNEVFIFQQDPSQLNLFLQRHYFQSIFSGIINLSPSTDALFIGLSDNGACLNFGRHGWFQAHGIPACGQSSGKIKTLSHIVDICTPFYKLQVW